MYSFDDVVDIGGAILENVTRAIDRNDFTGLNDSIKKNVQGFKQTYSGQRSSYGRMNRRYGEMNLSPVNKKAVGPFLKKKPSTTFSVVKIILGSLGLSISALSLFVMSLVASFFTSAGTIIGAVLAGLSTIGSVWLLSSGVSRRALIKQFERYALIVGHSEYYDVQSLSNQSREKKSKTIKNLKSMIKYKMLSYAQFDDSKSTLMLTPWVYEQYKLAEMAKAKAIAEEEHARNSIASMNVPIEAKKVLKDGQSFLKTIRLANEHITDSEMTEKISSMELIVDRIFKQVAQDPESAMELRKFMNYYLPTTEKLLNAYIELDRQPQVGVNIKNIKQEITEAMDTINMAFSNLFDSLYQEIAWDVSSDISVMKTMMAQDGLMKEKIYKNEEVKMDNNTEEKK